MVHDQQRKIIRVIPRDPELSDDDTGLRGRLKDRDATRRSRRWQSRSMLGRDATPVAQKFLDGSKRDLRRDLAIGRVSETEVAFDLLCKVIGVCTTEQ